MRRNDSEIKRKRNINTAMTRKAQSEEIIPVRVFKFFLTHRIPGQRTIDIPNMMDLQCDLYFFKYQ